GSRESEHRSRTRVASASAACPSTRVASASAPLTYHLPPTTQQPPTTYHLPPNNPLPPTTQDPLPPTNMIQVPRPRFPDRCNGWTHRVRCGDGGGSPVTIHTTSHVRCAGSGTCSCVWGTPTEVSE